MVVFFVIGVQFPGFDNKSIISGAINRTADANPVGPLGLPPSFSWESSVSLLYDVFISSLWMKSEQFNKLTIPRISS